jgi:hypothetical protein
MAYDKIAARLMSMSEDVWMRHANPWSGWTRVAVFPLWFIAIWSWTWIGLWALLPALVLGLWTWLNPRVFAPYKDDSSWITRGVLGERIFLNRKTVPIPRGHLVAAHVLSGLALLSMTGAIIGFVTADFWLALGVWLLAVTLKMWFVDRMVRLYEIMSKSNPEYRGWAKGPGHGNQVSLEMQGPPPCAPKDA